VKESISELNSFFGSTVAINATTKGKGKISISFKSEEDFNRIKNLLK